MGLGYTVAPAFYIRGARTRYGQADAGVRTLRRWIDLCRIDA
ncbi:MAG: hypothetical protein ABEJ48_07265 [Halobacteriales archaeon]